MEEYFTKKYSGLEQWTTLISLGCCPSIRCPWTRRNSITLEVSAPWGQGSCVVLPTVWSEHFSQNLWIRWFSINISWTIIIALSHYGELSTTSTHYHFPEWSSRRILNNLKSYCVTLNYVCLIFPTVKKKWFKDTNHHLGFYYTLYIHSKVQAEVFPWKFINSMD